MATGGCMDTKARLTSPTPIRGECGPSCEWRFAAALWQVVVSAPSPDADMFVMGVNHDTYVDALSPCFAAAGASAKASAKASAGPLERSDKPAGPLES